MIKVTCISDTHNKHDQLTIQPTDVLLHAGDFSGMGRVYETKAFMEWFSNQPAKHKIFISGNHDWLDYNEPAVFKELLKEYPTIKYLRDEGITVEGIKIWGRPWTKEFCGWAFMADPESPQMLSTLSVVPSGIDILLTHGPAYGILDRTKAGDYVGCKDLLNELERITPKYLICGHIHEAAGTKLAGPTLHINAAVLNECYVYRNKPTIFTIDKQ